MPPAKKPKEGETHRKLAMKYGVTGHVYVSPISFCHAQFVTIFSAFGVHHINI